MEKLNLINSLVFFDLETTGLDINSDRIIQFAAVKVLTDGTREMMNQFIDPLMPIKQEATDVHGYTTMDLVGCPIMEEIALDIIAFIGDADIAGYNIIRFDLPLLIEELGRCKVALDVSTRHIVDLYNIYRGLRPANLATAYKEYVGGEFDAHDAQSDSVATLEVALSIFSKEKEIVGDSIEQWESFGFDRSKMVDFAGKFIRDENGEICFNFGKDKGKNVKENMSFLNWMLDKEFTSDTKNWAKKLLNNG